MMNVVVIELSWPTFVPSPHICLLVKACSLTSRLENGTAFSPVIVQRLECWKITKAYAHLIDPQLASMSLVFKMSMFSLRLSLYLHLMIPTADDKTVKTFFSYLTWATQS